MNHNRNIIIDCDPGTDDALALLLASVTLRERLLCLLSTYGNAALSHTHGNLCGIARLLGLDCEILRGAVCPMGKEDFTPTHYHGENGLCGITLPREEADAAGLERVYALMRAAGCVTYVAVGPLTNLALLLGRYPDAAEYIEEMVIMGGGLEVGNVLPDGCGGFRGEYNFSLDPCAVEAVLRCPVRKVLAPLDLTHTLAFSVEEVAEMVGASAGEVRWERLTVRDMFGAVFYRNLESALREGHDGAIIHDAAAVAYVAARDACVVEEKRLVCDGDGCIAEAADGAAVEVILRMDKVRLKEMLRAAFRGIGT